MQACVHTYRFAEWKLVTEVSREQGNIAASDVRDNRNSVPPHKSEGSLVRRFMSPRILYSEGS